jgi:SAM-dependent methyltransferase
VDTPLRKYYAEAARILRPGGRLIVSEYHPFRRLWWNDGRNKRVMERSYFDRRPQHYDRSDEVGGAGKGTYPSVEFMWTVGDMATAMMDAGIQLDHFTECGEEVEDWEPPVKGLPGLLILSGRKR